MTLRGKVHHRVDAVLRKKPLDKGPVADVALDEDVARHGARLFRLRLNARRPIPRLDIREVFEVARIRERIEIDHAARKLRLRKEPVNEVRTDEAGAAGDEDGGE